MGQMILCVILKYVDYEEHKKNGLIDLWHSLKALVVYVCFSLSFTIELMI